MRLLSFIAYLAVIGSAGCKEKDPAYTVLPGRRMAEVDVLSQATSVLRPGPGGYTQFHVAFQDGIWEVSGVSNQITRTLTIRDADGVILQTNQP